MSSLLSAIVALATVVLVSLFGFGEPAEPGEAPEGKDSFIAVFSR